MPNLIYDELPESIRKDNGPRDVWSLELARLRRLILGALAFGTLWHVSAYGSSQCPREKAMKADIAAADARKDLTFSVAAAAVKSASTVQRQASILGLVMENGTFADAQRVLGPAEVRHNGGHGDASAHVSCYVGSDGTSLILSRSDEQSPMAITSFQLVSSFTLADLSEDEDFRPDSEAVPNCARSSILSRAIATGGGLKLGMTRSQVERALAHGLQCVSRSKCSVELEDKERGVPHSGTNVHPYARITVGLKQGRVTSIRIIYSSMI